MARSAEPCFLSASTLVTHSVQECWDVYIDQALTSNWTPIITKIDSADKLVQLGTVRKNYICAGANEGYTVDECTLIDPLKYIEFRVLEETFGFAHMLDHYGYSASFDADENGTLMIMKTHYLPKRIFASVMSSEFAQRQIVSTMEETVVAFRHFVQERITSAYPG